MLIQKFTSHLQRHFPFLKGRRLLLAVSGGVDSVVLTHLLQQLAFDITLAHCNFNLREKDSDADEAFVKELGKKLHVNVVSKSFATSSFAEKNKLSIQVAARNLRYAWFEEQINTGKFTYLLTAHHADDNLETFFINFLRGTGLKGLTGIPEYQPYIVRPLLPFSREEIVAFAKKKGLLWREDTSNYSTKYLRNRLRHEVIPILKELHPSLLLSFQRTTKYLQQSQQIVRASVANIKKDTFFPQKEGVFKIDICKLQSLVANPKEYLYELLKEYGFTEWDDVAYLLEAPSGKQVYSATHGLLKDRNALLLFKKEPPFPPKETVFFIGRETTKMQHPISLTFCFVANETEKNKKIIYVDNDRLSFPLVLRKWQEGDTFYPIGMQGRKKIGKLFKDLKYSLLDKKNSWLLCSDHNIVWVVGERQDRRFLADANTQKLLRISLHS